MDNQKPKGTFAKLMSTTPLPSPSDTQNKHDVVETKASILEVKNEAKSQERKILLGARITQQQFAAFKKLYLRLNNNDLNSNIDKGEVVGLAIETLSDLLDDTTEDFSTVNKLKSYLVNKLTKTRVP
jgi:hypothetical protein